MPRGPFGIACDTSHPRIGAALWQPPALCEPDGRVAAPKNERDPRPVAIVEALAVLLGWQCRQGDRQPMYANRLSLMGIWRDLSQS